MKSFRVIFLLCLTVLHCATVRAHDKNAPLNEEQKAFLAQYETVRAALAADDLSAVKKAAGAIVTESKTSAKEPATDEQKERQEKFAATVKAITTAHSLDEARAAFKALSKRAIHFAEGKEGYYIAECPMVPDGEGRWVQVSKAISNPYFGIARLSCGTIK